MGVQKPGVAPVAKVPQALAEPDQDSPVVPRRQVRDVLQEHSTGLQSLNDGQEARPQVGAGIVRRASAPGDQTAELGLTGPGERLARNPTGDEVDRGDPPRRQMREQLAGIGEIADVAEPPKVRDVCLHTGPVGVRPHQHGEAGVLEAQAQTAGAGEEVDGRRPRRRPHPSLHGLQIGWIGCIEGSIKDQIPSLLRVDGVAGLGLGQSHHLMLRRVRRRLCA